MARAAPPCMTHSDEFFHSANTWVGASKPYMNTSTSQQTSDSVVSGGFEFLSSRFICSASVQFIESIDCFIWVRLGSGNFSGKFFFLPSSTIRLEFNLLSENIGIEYIDQVTIAPGLVIPNQSIGVGNTVNCFFYLSLNHYNFLMPILVDRFQWHRWHSWVSYVVLNLERYLIPTFL